MIRSRELSDRAVRDQAEALLAYYRRAGLPLVDAFARWSASKDFSRDDLEAIRAEVFEP
jgi:hypothetical protein